MSITWQQQQQQQQQPFICTHTTYKIITINIVKLIESTACQTTIRAKKWADIKLHGIFIQLSVGNTLNTHKCKDTNRKETYSGTEYILIN